MQWVGGWGWRVRVTLYIRSVVIQGCVNHECDYRLTLDYTKSYYQLIIKITIFQEAQEITILLVK